MMTFWTGLLFGLIIGSVGTGVVLMFLAAVKTYDQEQFLFEDNLAELEAKLKGRRVVAITRP